MKCDGVLAPYPNTSGLQNAYNQRNAIDAPVEISLDVSVGSMIDVVIQVTANSLYTGNNLKFHTALIGENFDTTGGGWLQSNYQDVMLDMSPSGNGQVFSISPNETVDLAASFPIPTFTGLENLSVVGFVQDDMTREVKNAGYAPIPLDYPFLTLTDFEVSDPNGNMNGIPEPGEECELWVEFTNNPIFAAATGVTGTLYTDDPEITIIDGEANFPDITPANSGDNSDNPFVFEVDPGLQAHNVTFDVTVTAEGGTYSVTQYVTFMVGIPSFLIVDDDGGDSYETALMTDLDDMDIAYAVWEVNSQGSPTAEYLINYELVFWHTGMEDDPLTTDEQDALAGYMDAGRKLFMSSENLGDQLYGTTFYEDYFHCTHESDHISTTNLSGISGDPIANGTTMLIVGGMYWPDSQSSIIPDGDAFAVYEYNNPANSVAALRYEGGYTLLYFALPYECISPTTTSYTPRDEILTNILNWFAGFTELEPVENDIVLTNHLLCEVYPNPFNPETTISLTVPVSGDVEISAYNITGSKIGTVYDGRLNAGYHSFEFDGSELSSGVYFLHANSAAGNSIQKMVLMK